MCPGAGDERSGSYAHGPEEFEEAGPDLEALLDHARRLDPDQLKALIRLVRQALQDQNPAR